MAAFCGSQRDLPHEPGGVCRITLMTEGRAAIVTGANHGSGRHSIGPCPTRLRCAVQLPAG
jgi:hypothetical protein